MQERENLKTVIDSVESETERFIQRLKSYRERSEKEGNLYSSKEGASLRRSALDLKNELTRITQSISY